jgi:Dolichyl-phosphate-mannose-protein mannosyltransferase
MNQSTRPEKERLLFFLTLSSAVFVGLFLRVYLLKDQVFADDEWHGFYYVIGKSPFWLLAHFSIPGATCIPLNLYTWLLGATVGWSEIGLRLPLLVCGILCVLAGPLLAREIIGTRRAAWLALLLAISPLLIFYSRICRPYSAVALFAFAAILFAARWARFGGWRAGALYVIAAILAVYFHLFAIVATMTPALAAIVYHLLARIWRKQEQVTVKPPLLHWMIAAAIIVAVSALLMSAPMLQSARTTFFTIALKGSFSIQSLPRILMLISGTGQPVLIALFWVAFIIGAIEQCRRNPWFGGMLVSLFPLDILALLLSHPDSAQSAIVLVRYSIPLVPVSLLFAAGGIQAGLDAIAARAEFRPGLQNLIAFACAAALLLAGPLPQCYVTPNNFTSHGAFQYRYGRMDWSHSFYSDLTPPGFSLNTVIQAGEVSPFYSTLGKDPDGRPMVEYPMMIGDHFDPLYYYQHFSKRPVMVGYATDVALPLGLAAGNIYGDTYIDQVMSLVHDPSRLRFRNLISMDDLAAMRARGVEYIVLHKEFEAQLSAVAMPLPDLERLFEKYSREIGPPFYQDEHIAVFRL